MSNTLKIAYRNLLRYRRRTLLTSSLIALGVMAVLVFISVTGSFKQIMISQITDSMLGHLQIHRKGYLSSIDSLPLNRNLNPKQVTAIRKLLDGTEGIAAYAMRIKLGAMFSNFTETTNIRLNAVNPPAETRTVPLLQKRLVEGDSSGELVKAGSILIPELIAKGLKVKVGDTIVLVANNKEGSVNGKTFTVSGILESISGPGGRDGVIHFDDAVELLRLAPVEVSEIAIRLDDMNRLDDIGGQLSAAIAQMKNKQGKPVFEIHSWQKLSPFYNVSKMIDLMTLFIKIMLIAIVLVSIMNVMVMAVYERINEIGTIAAIGTLPGKIMGLFMAEGFLMALLGSAAGTVFSLVAIFIMNVRTITFDFGRQAGLVLQPAVHPLEFATVILIVIGIAILACLQPAVKAARMDPVAALRHV